MANEKATLKAAFLAAYNAQINTTTAQPQPITAISDAQANAIVAAIISAIATTTVIPVLTSPSGPVTGTITLTPTAS